MKPVFDNIEALIFDMDGTLIDSMWVWTSIDEVFLAKYDLREPENFHEGMEGKSYTETAQYFKDIFPTLTLSIEEIMDIWTEMAYERYTTQVPLKAGAREFISKMRAEGKKIGIATSNARELVDDTLKALEIQDLIDAVCTSCEAGAGKPAPDVYLKVAEMLGIDPKQCMAFEDVPMGIMAGVNAGMKTCAVEDDFSANLKEKKKELADYYINDYYEVL